MGNVIPFSTAKLGPAAAVRFEPIELLDRADLEACLVYVGAGITAVMTRPRDPLSDGRAGRWMVAKGFGEFEGRTESFDELDAARAWFTTRKPEAQLRRAESGQGS